MRAFIYWKIQRAFELGPTENYRHTLELSYGKFNLSELID